MNRNEQIAEALKPLFFWTKEPVMTAAVVTSAVIATMDYFTLTNAVSLSNELLALIIAWINCVGLIIRSQYTPYENR